MIELIVVVLIIAVLLAVALPAFLGARRRAADRAAQASARHALLAARSIALDDIDYRNVSDISITGVEPTLRAVPGTDPSDAPRVVSVFVDPGFEKFYAAVASTTGTCFVVRDVLTGSDTGTLYADHSGSCRADAAPGFNPGEWRSSW